LTDDGGVLSQAIVHGKLVADMVEDDASPPATLTLYF
jgi:hypothetical protein